MRQPVPYNRDPFRIWKFKQTRLTVNRVLGFKKPTHRSGKSGGALESLREQNSIPE